HPLRSCRLFSALLRRQPGSTLFPYTTLFRSRRGHGHHPARTQRQECCRRQQRSAQIVQHLASPNGRDGAIACRTAEQPGQQLPIDRKSTRLNSSHVKISYAVFCLKKKNNKKT